MSGRYRLLPPAPFATTLAVDGLLGVACALDAAEVALSDAVHMTSSLGDRSPRDRAVALAARMADDLAAVPGVVAIGLGGSWARGAGDTASDVDLGIYYSPDAPLDVDAVRTAALRHDQDAEVVGLGEWGPHIDGGAWLTVHGQRVDWIYRDLVKVRHAIEVADAGRLTFEYQPGHPLGFANIYYAAEVHHVIVLHDPDGQLAALKQRTATFPDALRASAADMLWEARFSLDNAAKPAKRGDVGHVAGLAYRAVMCMAYASSLRNRRWVMTEKGLIAAMAQLPDSGPHAAAEAVDVLGAVGRSPDELNRSVRRLTAVLDELEAVAVD